MVKIVVRTKSLLPSLKEKKRYVVFEVVSDEEHSLNSVQALIFNQAKTMFGTYGLSNMGLRFMDDWNNNQGIVKVNNKYVDYLRSCFVCLAKDGLMIRTVKISGILKKARNIGG